MKDSHQGNEEQYGDDLNSQPVSVKEETTEVAGLGDGALENDPAARILEDRCNGDGKKGDSQKQAGSPLRPHSDFPGRFLKQHDDKEDDDHDGPCIDDNHESGQERCPEQEEEGCRAQEGNDQIEHGMNRLAPGYGETRCRKDDDSEQIKGGSV